MTPVAFFVVFTAIAVAIAAFGAAATVRARRRLGWPTIDGAITHAEVITVIARDSDTGGRRTEYGLEVRYEYSLTDDVRFGERHARRYTGTYFSSTSYRRRTWEARLADYPLGKRVTVFYDPANHAQSTIDPRGEAQSATVLMLAGAAFAAIGLLMAWLWPRL